MSCFHKEEEEDTSQSFASRAAYDNGTAIKQTVQSPSNDSDACSEINPEVGGLLLLCTVTVFPLLQPEQTPSPS